MPEKKQRVQTSVFLDRDTTHRSAKIAAMDAGLSLTQWIEALVMKELSKKKRAA